MIAMNPPPCLTPRLKPRPRSEMLSLPATTTPVAIPASPRKMVAPRIENPVLTMLKKRDCARRIPRTLERVSDSMVPFEGLESRGHKHVQETGILLEPMAVAAVLIQPMIKSTIITVAAVAARSTVLCSDCLSVATRGTETCAVPTVSDDGIELVMLVKPGSKGQLLARSCTGEAQHKD